MKHRLYRKVENASKIIEKVSKESWIKSIRKSREER